MQDILCAGNGQQTFFYWKGPLRNITKTVSMVLTVLIHDLS